ncbi:MAG: lipid-A-disaccharide synthase [Cryomorphaceae bacterium BACL21 MAG-121220-bin10]|jgi:lipid-A-disaccharide synthase|nr:MAG: lipid-A-disaccharide synthase [Cryomorphaceae bacterium BACL21 MAG-121220-bin10]
MKYYIISGEASGDLHGSNLINALKTEDNDAAFRGWGGELMQAQGMTLVKHYRDLAFMGFIEVLFHLRTILSNISFCQKDIEAYQPDALILIDYPGFNLRIAKWARKKGIPVHYYISPQIWAWKENRIKAINRDVDALYVILPFESEFYARHKRAVHFVGHPLLDALSKRPQVDPKDFIKKHDLNELPIIALLPGSRKQEIKAMLKVMLQMVNRFPDHQFIIAGAPSIDPSTYAPFIGNKRVDICFGQTYDLLDVAEAALVTSGTATLETALLNVPQVVCYRGNWLSYQIAKRIVNLKYISLVNLILDRAAVKELIQGELNPKSLEISLSQILSPEGRKKVFVDYSELINRLGGPGASRNTAQLIYKHLQK